MRVNHPIRIALGTPYSALAQYGMWRIEEHRRVYKCYKRRSAAPNEILKRYEKCKDVASLSGPAGVAGIKGFYDEAPSREWEGYRSCRPGLEWRVVYRVVASELVFRVASVTRCDCRRS